MMMKIKKKKKWKELEMGYRNKEKKGNEGNEER